MKILTTLCVLSSLVIIGFAQDLDTILSKITAKRKSPIDQKIIAATPSPMPKLVKITDTNGTKSDSNQTTIEAKVQTYKLMGIMNNSANINGQWVKLGEKIGEYKLVDIMDNAVYLKGEKKEKTLFFEQKYSNIKISIGR